ncbi:fibrinogen-like protein A [Anneissia japonica]|uniref:fibrinogen-like protein A n=1 Tax=Anneissia japonica TaxID=1529436 RepID=UPI0014255C09|nr:fibrinogen-like protein A [Anneissia japonica]
MFFRKVLLVVAICRVPSLYAVSDNCEFFTHMLKNNEKRLENQAVEVINGIRSLTECWGRCIRRYDCKSFNYAETLSVCELNSNFVGFGAPTLTNDTKYVYITTVDAASCELSSNASSMECCSDDTGSYNLEQRSCPASSSKWCTCVSGFTGPKCSLSHSFSGTAVSCQQYQEAGHNVSGVMQIDPIGNNTSNVICDMTTDGGGWTVILRRSDGSRLFNNTWDEYVSGFGSVNDEYWLGLENIYQLTAPSIDGNLRVELSDASGNKFYATYSFGILENTHYEARFTYIDGDAVDSLSYHDNMQFITRDLISVSTCVGDEYEIEETSYQPNETNSEMSEAVIDGISCSEYAGGTGWWFKSGLVKCTDCFRSNLNAPHGSLVWGSLENLKQVEIKYRK